MNTYRHTTLVAMAISLTAAAGCVSGGDDFTAEDEKRWKKQILEWDGRWAEQQKVNKDLAVQFPPIRKEIDSVKALVRQLWRLQETYGTQRMQEAQRWLQALESSLGDIPKELK